MTSMLGVGVAVSILIGCGTGPAPQPSQEVVEPLVQEMEKPTAETPQVESASPDATIAKNSELEPSIVEVGYKVGMQVPEFGMSLVDGTTVSSVSLANQGKPTFLYFHATW